MKWEMRLAGGKIPNKTVFFAEFLDSGGLKKNTKSVDLPKASCPLLLWHFEPQHVVK